MTEKRKKAAAVDEAIPSFCTIDTAAKLTVLIADDSPMCSDIIMDILSKRCHVNRIVRARDGHEAWKMFLEFNPQVIVLDWEMPNISGIDLLEAIRSRLKGASSRDPEQTKTSGLPYIVMYTSKADSRMLAEALGRGADDYIRKNADPIETEARLRVALRCAAYMQESDDEKQKFKTLSRTDALTGLANRRNIEERITEEIARAVRARRDVSLMSLDIDFFKQINDTYGHETGDMAILHVANILRKSIRCSDVVGRMGGDEFVVILSETNLHYGAQVADRIVLQIRNEPFIFEGKPIRLSVSAGLASGIPKTFEDGKAFLAEADKMLYQSKQNGRGRASKTNVTIIS